MPAESGANRIHLTPRQRNFDDVHARSRRNLINLMQSFRRQVRGMSASPREGDTVAPKLHAAGVASPFHLFKCCSLEQVQVSVAPMFDGTTQVFARRAAKLWGSLRLKAAAAIQFTTQRQNSRRFVIPSEKLP